PETSRPIEDEEHEKFTFESRIGESGLAWLGSFVLFFSVIFLMSYIRSKNQQLLAGTIGYLGTAALFAFAYFMRNSSQNIIKILRIIGYILLFYVTIRLHFFSKEPLITNLYLSIALVLISIGFVFLHAVRRKSEFVASIGLLMTVLLALFADSSYETFSLLLICAAVSIYFVYRFSWWKGVFFSMIGVYLSHLLWLTGNPVMGHEMVAVNAHENNLIFLFAYGLIFSAIAFKERSAIFKEPVYISAIIWNGLSFSVVVLSVVYLFFKEDFVFIFEVITVLCIAYSVYLHLKVYSLFVPSIYAVYGFMALSIVVYGYASVPIVFLYLGIQSLFVLSLALWYRSKTIVIVNIILFVGLLITYLAITQINNSVNFTFAIVALASARIIYWQKEKLSLQTENLRNVYLFAAFISILVFLYHVIPYEYVTFAWTGIAALFFVLSILIKNVKYRYLSIATILVTIVYLFFIDLSKMDFGLRVLSFLAVGILTLVVSLYYARKKKVVLEPNKKEEVE
ncbi:MAG: DUF2339 domain-containing protein, partial [Bacteroidetes bacterium]|nr:DUF2339 domain-containing protein [Bacteroidota bacterium]